MLVSNTEAIPAPCVGTSGSSEWYHTHYNPAVKFCGHNKEVSASGSATAIGTEAGTSFSQQPPSAPRNSSIVGGDVWAKGETIPDSDRTGDGNFHLIGAWAGGVPPEGNEEKQEVSTRGSNGNGTMKLMTQILSGWGEEL